MSGLGAPPDGAPLPKADPGGDGIDLWAYASAMLRHRYLIAVVALAAAGWAGIASLLSPRQYTAAASFVPQDAPAQSGLSQLATQLGFATARASTSSPSFYVDLLQSREVLREVVNTGYAAAGSPAFKGDLVQYFKIASPDRDEAVAKAVQKLKLALTVRANANTGVVRFEVDTRNPMLSRQITDRLLGLVNDYNLRRRQSQARAEREFVEERLTQAQRSLTEAEDAVAAFYGRNRRYTDSPELVAAEARLQRQVMLRQQVYLTLAQSHEVAKIEEVRNTPVITVVEHPEGFVEKKPRGTILKVVITLFGGTILGLALAFAKEYLSKAQAAGSSHYREFVTLSSEVVKGLRGGRFRSR